jgi:hypothetical protein
MTVCQHQDSNLAPLDGKLVEPRRIHHDRHYGWLKMFYDVPGWMLLPGTLLMLSLSRSPWNPSVTKEFKVLIPLMLNRPLGDKLGLSMDLEFTLSFIDIMEILPCKTLG